MPGIYALTEGQKYRVKKEFIDHDRIVHPVGEEWFFEKVTAVAYHDGICLYVHHNGESVMYRLQDFPGEQDEILRHFPDYVEPAE